MIYAFCRNLSIVSFFDSNLRWKSKNEIEVMYKINLIKIQFFIILSYEDLTATHSGSCADDLYR